MSVKRLHEEWRARERSVPANPVLRLEPEGLMLGAGTVLVPADAERQLQKLEGREIRTLALLSAAYGKPVPESVLGHIERAARCWSQGQDGLAAIHLALSGLNPPQDPREAAHRLFFADELMKAGASPHAVLEAIHHGYPFIERAEKFYNEAELRVPAGSPEGSGEWTRAFSFLESLSPAAVTFLGRLALGLSVAGGVAGAFGLLFVPSPNKGAAEGDIPGWPGWRYALKPGETELRLTYEGPGGERRTITAQEQEDLFRDRSGRVVGRLLPNGSVVIDPRGFMPPATNDNGPNLCPAPEEDKVGRGDQRGKLDKDYQDFIKAIVNPGNQTPRDLAYYLTNPQRNGKRVSYDDCQHSTGMMVEVKHGYVDLISDPRTRVFIEAQFLDQSLRQVQAGSWRKVKWYFSRRETAEFAAKLFEARDNGREKIDIIYMPFPGE